ncbi:class III poly(R)-hydroxyalkanoic acid synthase subunit PhaE [uncultured Thiothrix sp.]|uniref:class III poly(R)-hydroxyalkanoic acid synthase subunit PhaE n=1 Tax=uncultured Thiothrix sp. TaxID=223185 RepID=UPI00262B8F21|nr:class III poly(R)-hydroxyalkanoic acid synthase subunit PhaE [uncultured Thiothrix sp.]
MSSKQWSEEAIKTWLEVQQRYWSTLSNSFNPSSTPSTVNNSQAPTWANDLNQWWSTVTQDSPPQIQDVLNRVMDMGKVYLGLAEQVYSNSKTDPDTPSIESWMRSLESGFNQWFQQGGQPASNLGLGQSVLDGWQQLVGNMQGMNLFREVGTGGLTMPNAGLWQEHLQKALATPSFGLSREGQERLKKLSALALRYQQAMDKYREAFATQGQESVQALRIRIQKLADQGKNISSLRELYDLWVDVSEETYAQFAASEQYQTLYGELVNAFLLLKQGMNEHLDHEFKAFGLPVRADYEATIKKQYELKRENNALRQHLRELDQRLKRIEQAMQTTATQEAAQ